MAAKKEVPITDAETIKQVQTTLRSIGYVEAGPPDGDLVSKGKTEAAILDVRNNLDLPLTPTIDAQLIEALKTAPARPVPIEQATATAADIAPKVDAVQKNWWSRLWSKILAIPSAVFTVLVAVIDNLGDATEKLTPVKAFLSEVPVWIWPGLVAIVAFIISRTAGKAEEAMVDGYQRGTVRNDAAAPPVTAEQESK